MVEDYEGQGLGLTYWFDTETEGEPYPVTIRFAGRRIGVKGKPGRRDSFNIVQSLENVVPGSGPVAITARVFDVSPGEWNVTATPLTDTSRRVPARRSPSMRRSRLPNASSYRVLRPHRTESTPGARLVPGPGPSWASASSSR